jgi:tetratricopeptide (TPR) repeat protein
MRSFFTSIFLFLLSAILVLKGSAQQKKGTTDSLRILLEKHSAADTTRLDLLTNLARAYFYVNPDSAIVYGNQAVPVALQLNDKKRLASAYRFRGHAYRSAGKFEEAKNNFQEALAVNESIGNKNGVADMLNNIGNVYDSQSDYVTAIDYFLRGLKILEGTGDDNKLGAAYGNIGVIWRRLEDFPKAISYYEKAIVLFKKVGNNENHAAALGNIGEAYCRMPQPDYAKALLYETNALHILEQTGQNRVIPNCLNAFASIYDSLKDYKRSLEYLEQSLAASAKIHEKNSMAISYLYKAEVYMKAPDSVLKLFGIAKADRFSKALALQDLSTKLFRETSDYNFEIDAWKNMSVIYEGMKDYPKALDAFKQYHILHDSIYNNKKKEAIIRYQVQYEQDKKDALNLAEVNRQHTIRNFSIAGAAIVTLASLLLFIFYKRRRDANAMQKEAELNAEISNTKMKALRAQMNPHFIFNSLNSISDYIAKNNTKMADEYLVKFAKLMRLILENSEQKEVPLSEDLKALELYMQLESLRMNNKFTYEIKVDDAIDKENTLVPPLILQPFVENSIWHGIAQKQGQGNIIVHIKKEGDMINCSVEDNGIGRKEAALFAAGIPNGEKKSLGMKITKERIDVMNKIRKTAAIIQLSDLQQGTRVEVRLPLETSF